MENSVNYKRKTIFNFLSLPVGIAIIGAILYVVLQIIDVTVVEPPCTDCSPMTYKASVAIFYMFIAFVIAVIVFILWSVKIINDLMKHKKHKKFLLFNAIILSIPYLLILIPLFFDGINTLVDEYRFRKSIVKIPTKQIYIEDKMLLYDVMINDTLFLLTSSEKNSDNKNISIKNEHKLFVNDKDLHLFAIVDGEVLNYSNLDKIIEKQEIVEFETEALNSFDKPTGKTWYIEKDFYLVENKSFQNIQNIDYQQEKIAKYYSFERSHASKWKIFYEDPNQSNYMFLHPTRERKREYRGRHGGFYIQLYIAKFGKDTFTPFQTDIEVDYYPYTDNNTYRIRTAYLTRNKSVYLPADRGVICSDGTLQLRIVIDYFTIN